MEVALVYDRVNKWGGAERVLLALHELFPEAPLYTSVYNSETAQWAKVFPKVHTSFLQYFPCAKKHHDLYALLMPFVFRSFDFSKFDLVVSVTSEAAKGIVVGPKTRHICYCLTPTRYLWSGYNEYFSNPLRRILTRPFVELLRKWDKKAAIKPDLMVGISQTVAGRIKKYYGRRAEIIYPPVKINSKRLQRPAGEIRISKYKEYFLVVSRLVPYKKVDLVIEAFNALRLPLVIVGAGSEERSLKMQSKSKNTIFVGKVSDDELLEYYKNCKALIFPQEEDFGLVAVEAQLVGKPVLAYKSGGATETVVDGKTGLFFGDQKVESIINTVRKFEKYSFKPRDCRLNAEKFSKEKFLKRFATLVKSV